MLNYIFGFNCYAKFYNFIIFVIHSTFFKRFLDLFGRIYVFIKNLNQMRKTVSCFVVMSVLLLGSCKRITEVNPAPPSTSTTPPTSTISPNADVNTWIYDQMKSYYLWEDQMVAATATNKALKPDEYFESILVKPGDLDRFSWIQESAEQLTASLNGINKVAGIRFSPFFANEAKTKVALSVAYALKGSPAEKAGLKRGDLITQVNGSDLTPENYGNAFANDNITVTIGEYKSGIISSTATKLSLTKAEVTTDPLQYSSVIEMGDKKVGYLVYLQFLGTTTQNALRNVFRDFKTKGVNELVLDLRYNGGGFISTSDVLSSLIVKNLKPGTLMNRQEWNAAITKAQKAKYGAEVFDSKWLNESNNLGTLNRVYVLTSKGSASASELVINNLKPFMDVILVGDNTYGKSVGSVTLSDEKKRWTWGMQPIVLRTVNALGKADYGSKDGFTPDVRVKDDIIPYKPFGSKDETLLAAALAHMTGGVVAKGARVGTKQVSLIERGFPAERRNLELHDMYIDAFPKK
jgi:carboxyl-terminal processing protease